MWLLYLDESGSADQHHNLVLAGPAVFEGQIFKLTQALEDVASARLPKSTEPVELHISELRRLSADKESGFTRDDFFAVLDDIVLQPHLSL